MAYVLDITRQARTDGVLAASVTFIYSTNFSARVDVRNGSGVAPIIPFSTLLSVTSAGASVNASRNSDV